jgi:hypothetical protein
MGKMITAYKLEVKKPKGNRPLGGPRHRLQGNIKTDINKGKQV